MQKEPSLDGRSSEHQPVRRDTRRHGDHRRLALRAAAGTLAGLTLLMGGCRDSFMNPSIVGNWENTPTIVPVLDRIAAIEEDDTGIASASEPMAEDLLPQPSSYIITSGDALTITLYDMIVTDRPENYEVVVDARGMVDLPQLGRVQVGNKSLEQARNDIQQAMRAFVNSPLAQINVVNSRGNTYYIVGNVERSGQFVVPGSNFRLLEAITAGGRFDESVSEIYVIRQVALSDSATDRPLPEGGTPAPMNPNGNTPAPLPAQQTPPKSGQDILDVINDITGPGTKDTAPPKQPSPGVMPAAGGGVRYAVRAGPDNMAPPPVDLVDVPAAKTPTQPGGANSWVFLNGKWVQLNAAKAAAQSAAAGGPMKAKDLMAQRVIKVPVKQLLAGNQAYNIIVRSGDVIRIPQPPTGFVYMAGQIGRPGPIQLPSTGGMTLLRAIDAAGGPGDIAIPTKVDLTRMLGTDREATIRLDIRAISQRQQPDVYLKPNDRVNIGTNFWAYPLAVIRNGFRVNYGWGLVIDRNFGNDIFGPPPEARPQN